MGRADARRGGGGVRRGEQGLFAGKKLFVRYSFIILFGKFYIQESRLGVKLKSFSAFDARLWNCLPRLV